MLGKLGKTVFRKTYLHIDALDAVDSRRSREIFRAADAAGLTPRDDFNVVRFEQDSSCVALMHYADFYDSPFPELRERWSIDLSNQEVLHRTYRDSLNPPILHRKELLIQRNHPRWVEYAALTKEAENLGLFECSNRIGYRVQWHQLIKDAGYILQGHQFVPLGNDAIVADDDHEPLSSDKIARHRTALSRSGFSAPVQSLNRYGFLDGNYSLFDYGCGRGDDVRGLRENGIDAAGWDPYFAAGQPLVEADIVNLGFVVNVIEDIDERIAAVASAYSLSRQLLVVSVMLTNSAGSGTPMNDGILTTRHTFQKYYTQAEIKAFIDAVVDQDSLPVCPGVLYVFRDDVARQRFHANRYRRDVRSRLPYRSSDLKREQRRANISEAKYAQYKERLESLWVTCLDFGRAPDPSESPGFDDLVDGFGSLSRALKFLVSRKVAHELEEARARRTEDLLVYMALREFEGKPLKVNLDRRIRLDAKAFFGTITAARREVRETLFQIADTEAVSCACKQASERGLGFYETGRYLQLHTSLVEHLPPLLRIYVGCAAALYGDYRSADLVKIHVASGKLSLLRFDDFQNRSLPRLIERVKVNLRDQTLDYFMYDDNSHEPPYLYWKSRYINEEYPNYPEQVAFDEQLESFPFLDLSGYGPKRALLDEALQTYRWRVDNFQLKRVDSMPNLNAPCGRYLTYRQLIECGETQRETRIPNLPRSPDTYSALLDLATNVLDPVIEYFGMIKLTYGFCSHDLQKVIRERIRPDLDQHGAHELRRTGRPVCARLGAAVDFLVEYENMEEVAIWIAENTPFDRLYYYGRQLPLHVSFGPDHKRDFVEMRKSVNGALIPKLKKLF